MPTPSACKHASKYMNRDVRARESSNLLYVKAGLSRNLTTLSSLSSLSSMSLSPSLYLSIPLFFKKMKALLRNLTTEVIRHGRITTTLHRAKAVRGEVDRMIGLAKVLTLLALLVQHTAVYVSAYCCVFVLILVYVCRGSQRAAVYLCPHTRTQSTCVLILVYMSPRTGTYACTCSYYSMRVPILLYMWRKDGSLAAACSELLY